jgi:hypothetical protein
LQQTHSDLFLTHTCKGRYTRIKLPETKEEQEQASKQTNKKSPINNHKNQSKFRHRKNLEEVGKRKSRKEKGQLAGKKISLNTALQPRKAKQEHKHIQQKTTKKAT